MDKEPEQSEIPIDVRSEKGGILDIWKFCYKLDAKIDSLNNNIKVAIALLISILAAALVNIIGV